MKSGLIVAGSSRSARPTIGAPEGKLVLYRKRYYRMGLFGSKDWNIVAIIFERPDLYRVNGNRGRGREATTMRDAAKKHPRTIFCAVFDQKGAFLEGEAGSGATAIPTLEAGKEDKVSKSLAWSGYPVKPEPRPE
jgi:hypothetical protein